MTPPILPAPPDRPEPPNPWAPPAGPPAPYPAYPAPEPPQRTSRLGPAIAGALGLVVVVMLAVAFYSISKDRDRNIAVTTTSSPPTTTTPPKPFAEIGDCVKVTGSSFSPNYKKVACEGGLHNYVVSKLPATDSEKCGDDADSYTKYTNYGGASNRKNAYVCLIPAFVDGQCYDFTLSSLNTELKTAECGGFQVVRTKVLANTADKAACGESPALALAYPEIRTTYCFTHTFQYGG